MDEAPRSKYKYFNDTEAFWSCPISCFSRRRLTDHWPDGRYSLGRSKFIERVCILSRFSFAAKTRWHTLQFELGETFRFHDKWCTASEHIQSVRALSDARNCVFLPSGTFTSWRCRFCLEFNLCAGFIRFTAVAVAAAAPNLMSLFCRFDVWKCSVKTTHVSREFCSNNYTICFSQHFSVFFSAFVCLLPPDAWQQCNVPLREISRQNRSFILLLDSFQRRIAQRIRCEAAKSAIHSHQIVMKFWCRGSEKSPNHSNLIFNFSPPVNDPRPIRCAEWWMMSAWVIRYSWGHKANQKRFHFSVILVQPFVNNPVNFITVDTMKVKPQLICVMGKYVFMCFMLRRRKFRRPPENRSWRIQFYGRFGRV